MSDDATTPATSPLAIVAFVAAFVLPPAAVVVGHLALHQIRRSGLAGRGLALAGTVLGYLFTVVGGASLVIYLTTVLAQLGI